MEMLLECPCHRKGRSCLVGPSKVHSSCCTIHKRCRYRMRTQLVSRKLPGSSSRIDGGCKCSCSHFRRIYAGWGPGQLEEELRVGGWLVAETDVSELFGDCEEIWERALRRIGRDIISCVTGNVPLPPINGELKAWSTDALRRER